MATNETVLAGENQAIGFVQPTTRDNSVAKTLKTASDLNGPIVEALVGVKPQQKSFFLHEELLAARSLYCRKLFERFKAGQHLWSVGEKGLIRLPEYDPVVFASYVQLLYQKKLPAPLGLFDVDNDTESEEELAWRIGQGAYRDCMFLAKLYVLIAKMQDSEAKCIVITAFTESASLIREDGSNRFPDDEVVRMVYAGTKRGDPMRLLVANFYSFHYNLDWILSVEEDNLPYEFTLKVMQGMCRGKELRKEMFRKWNARTYCALVDHMA